MCIGVIRCRSGGFNNFMLGDVMHFSMVPIAGERARERPEHGVFHRVYDGFERRDKVWSFTLQPVINKCISLYLFINIMYSAELRCLFLSYLKVA